MPWSKIQNRQSWPSRAVVGGEHRASLSLPHPCPEAFLQGSLGTQRGVPHICFTAAYSTGERGSSTLEQLACKLLVQPVSTNLMLEHGVMRMVCSPHVGCSPVSLQILNLTTGWEKWSSDRPTSITCSVQWNSPGESTGKASGMGWRVTERQKSVCLSPRRR